MNVNDAIPWIVGGLGLIVAAKFISDQNSTPPPPESDAATVDFPTFPEFGSDPSSFEMVPPLEWPHPYAHPRIPRYVKGPAYFQNTAPIYDPNYFKDNQLWYGQVENYPPLQVTVSQNLPTSETYSHHHFYFDQKPETKPIDSGIFKNIV